MFAKYSLVLRCAVWAALGALSNLGQSIPAELSGEWSSSDVRTSQFTDRATGSFSSPSGTIVQYRIGPEGQYTEQALIQSSMYNCTMTVFVTEWGRVSIDGARLLFQSAGGKLNSHDNCNARFNYSKTLQPKAYVYTPWGVRQGPSGPELCMVNAQQQRVCYTRKN